MSTCGEEHAVKYRDSGKFQTRRVWPSETRNRMSDQIPVAKKCCGRCLLGPKPLVSDEDVLKVEQANLAEGTLFHCHKFTQARSIADAETYTEAREAGKDSAQASREADAAMDAIPHGACRAFFEKHATEQQRQQAVFVDTPYVDPQEDIFWSAPHLD